VADLTDLNKLPKRHPCDAVDTSRGERTEAKEIQTSFAKTLDFELRVDEE
jgi:hypothetical protein